MNAALVPVIVISNQSGIGRGLYSEADYEQVKTRLDDVLRQHGAYIDASYYCPHSPDDGCACRKPGTLLFERAIADFRIDPSTALLIGDRFRDIEPAARLGARGVLVPTDDTPPDEVQRARDSARVADSLATALDW